VIVPRVLYWDASAIVSAIVRDERSDRVEDLVSRDATHLVSSLAWAETHAVVARAERDGRLAPVLCDAARDALNAPLWRRANIAPDWNIVANLARSRALRGADLWHLATAKTLLADIPELLFVSFDQRLVDAATEAGLTLA